MHCPQCMKGNKERKGILRERKWAVGTRQSPSRGEQKKPAIEEKQPSIIIIKERKSKNKRMRKTIEKDIQDILKQNEYRTHRKAKQK